MLQTIFHSFQVCLRNSPPAKGWVKNQGIDQDAVEVGLDTGRHHRDKDEAYLKECIELGLVQQLNSQRYSSFAKDHLIFSLKDEKETIVNLFAQPLKKGKRGKYLRENLGHFPSFPNTDTRHIIICENVLESAQVTSNSTDTHTTIMALDDGLFTERHQLALMHSVELTEVTFSQYHSTPIRTSIENFITEHIGITTFNTYEFSANRDSDPFEELIEETQQLSKAALDTTDPERLLFQQGQLTFAILGGLSEKLDELKVTIRITHEARKDAGFRDSVNLYNRTRLAELITNASDALFTQTEEMLKAIELLTKELEQFREEQRQQTQRIKALFASDLDGNRKQQAISNHKLIPTGTRNQGGSDNGRTPFSQYNGGVSPDRPWAIIRCHWEVSSVGVKSGRVMIKMNITLATIRQTMGFQEKLKQVDELQNKILEHGNLDGEIKKRINYKFRLDWNYHSNSMEGNTLTKAETRSVMVRALEVKGKPYKDVAEMHGHDEVVQEMLRIGKSEVMLSEKRIRDIHKAIMFEESEEGKGKIGEWKKVENHIINYRGEKFDFTQPMDVPFAMHDLLNGINASIHGIAQGKKDAVHPAELAFYFHLQYLTIHPFYDGNGRTARLLTNLLLISFGYPPLIIRTEEKEKYYHYLADIQSYGGKQNLLFEHLADLLIRSQQIVLDAIAGKSIEEPDDIDKEIQLFKGQFATPAIPDVPYKSDKLIAKVFLEKLTLVFERLELKHQSISELFTSTNVRGMVNNVSKIGRSSREYINEVIEQVSQGNFANVNPRRGKDGEWLINVENVRMVVEHRGFKKSELNYFDFEHDVTMKFDDYEVVVGDNLGFKTKFKYNELPSEIEIGGMVSDMIRKVLEKIKIKAGNGAT